MLLSVFLLGFIPQTQAKMVVTDIPLEDYISLGTYYYTAVNENVDKDDYMLINYEDGTQWFSSMGETIFSKDGETSAGTGTSYVDLSASCLMGDYASYPYSWADFAYLKSSFSSSVTKVSGDSAWTVGTNCTAPSLSAGPTTAYIKMQMAGTANALTGNNEEINFISEVWHDIDGDGVDDSASVAEEDYIPLQSTTYLYGTAMVDASDTDKDAHGYIIVAFYVDSSTNYLLRINFEGGETASDSTYVADWVTDSDGTEAGTGTGATKLDFFECEGQAVTFLIDIADMISDDATDSPVISGIDWWKMGIYAEDAYGDDTSDTIDFYVYNLAVVDEIPALTDNDASSTWDINQGDNIAIYGEDDYFLTHDCLQPVVSADTANTFNNKVYFDADFKNGDMLCNQWRHIKVMGEAKKLMNMEESYVRTGVGTAPNRRDCYYTFDFNQMRIHESREEELSTTYQPSYSSQIFKIRTDNDDFYSPENEYDQDLVEQINGEWAITVKGINKYETFQQNLANQADNTWVSIYTFGSTDSEGTFVLKYSYQTQDSGTAEGGQIVLPIGAGISIGTTALVGFLTVISIALIYIKKKRK